MQDSTKCFWQKYKKLRILIFSGLYLSFVLLLKKKFVMANTCVIYLISEFLPSQIAKMPTPIRTMKVDIIYMF